MTELQTEHDPTREDEEHGDTEHAGEHEHEPATEHDVDDEPEAERAQLGEHDSDVEPAGEHEHEPPPLVDPAGSLTDRELEKAMKALDNEEQRHAKRLAEIMGEDFATLQRCPLCPSPFPGYRWPVPPPAEVIAAVKEAIGEPAQPAFRADSYSKVCELCDGLGAVATGSKVAGQGTARCLGCEGRGWVAVGPERQSGAITTPAAVPAPVQYDQQPPTPVEPPEVAALKALGYVVVAPIQPLPAAG